MSLPDQIDMAGSPVQNPSAPVESKSARKKKAKAAAAAERNESPAPASQKAASVAGTEDDHSENAHIRELQKYVFCLA